MSAGTVGPKGDDRRRPNVVCFISDDTAFSMLGYSGGAVLTPNIDALARGGVQCTRYHTSTPVCTPSRYSNLTGHYAGRCPADNFRDGFPDGEPYCITWNTDLMPDREQCIGQALQRAGYVTGHVGKWHTGPSERALGVDFFQPDDDPCDPAIDAKLKEHQRALVEQVRSNGFDYAASICWGDVDGRTIKKLHSHNLDWTAWGALDFLDRHGRSDRPFFLYVAPTTIHGPSHVLSLVSDPHMTGAGRLEEHVGLMPPRLSVIERIELADNVPLNHRTAGALWMDDLVGTVVARLGELGLEDDTIVIFSTDHGAFDGKATCYQGGVHIPFAMRWPGRIPAGSTCDALIQHIDFLPTMLAACGAPLPDGMAADGKDMLPWLTGEKVEDEDREDLFFEFGYVRAVATRKWKYIAVRYPPRLVEDMKSGKVDEACSYTGRSWQSATMQRYPHYFEPDQLYDLDSDPEEQNNLAYEPGHAGVLAEMKERLLGYLETFERPFDLDTVDEFLLSDRFRQMGRKAAAADMNRFDWYRKGWY